MAFNHNKNQLAYIQKHLSKKNILNDNRVIAFLIQDKKADLFVRKLLMLLSITGGSTIVYNISVPTLSSGKIKIFQLSIMDAIII